MTTGSVFRTTNGGKEVWCACYTFFDAKGKKTFVRGYADASLGEEDGKRLAIRRRETNLRKRLRSGGIERKQFSPRLSAYITTWLDDYPPDKLSDEVRRKYRRDIEHHVTPYLDPMIADLTTDDLRDLFYRRLPSTATNAARWNAYKTLRNMLNHAVKNGLIVVSPLSLVDPPKLQSKVRRDDDKWISRRVGLTKGLLRWLAEPSNPYHDHYPRILMMFLGLRRGELLGLEWSCITNLNRKGKASITVRQQLQRRTGGGWFITPQTKTRKDRIVPLPELWRKALLEERAKKRTIADKSESWADDLVFKTEGGRWVDYNTHSDAWTEILTAYVNNRRTEKKPIDETYYFRPHAARHVTASMLFEQGVPLEVAQEIMGHSDRAMTLYYTHMTRTQKQRAVESLGDVLGGDTQ